MANTDRYIMGLVENLQNLTGTLSEPLSINGYLSNATLRGIPIELRIQDGTSILQWKYLDEETWQDLIELNNLNYEELINHPSINDITLIGNLTPADLGLSTRSEGIATISRSGLTYTVTRPDGSTFSFDQLDQENVIESVSVNGTRLPVNNKNVNVAVPTATSQLQNDSDYATSAYVDGEISALDTKLYNETTSLDTKIDSEVAALDTKIDSEISATNQSVTDLGTTLSSTATEIRGEIQEVSDSIPTAVSELTNDANYATQSYVDSGIDSIAAVMPTKVSDLTNDEGFTTQTYVDTELAKKEDVLQYGTASSTSIGKALMPKTVSDGKVTEWKFGEAGKVDDVQINKTSILSNKIANIPIANTSKLGVVKAHSLSGISIDAQGVLNINPATSAEIQSGINPSKPIVTSNEYAAAFYGLAKAAGDRTQSESSNSIGKYTDEAKGKIQSMLGIDTAIADAVGQITGFDFSVVQELPASGVKGVIYLVAHSHGDNDGYDEYIWINNGFEKLGHCDIDLTDYATIDYVDNELENKVDDIQINGTSIVSDGVANIFNLEGLYGIVKTSNGYLAIRGASSSYIKHGQSYGEPILPTKQHESVFYGLAKAAGHDEKDSTEPLGTYTDEAKTAIQTMLGVPADDEVVRDVQINGTSIVSNGAANIPIASYNDFGAIKIDNNNQRGLEITNGVLQIRTTTLSDIKGSWGDKKVLTPPLQYASTFYGLAKAAGDTTQSQSSNAVGTYTSEAKVAIQSMLGIPDTITAELASYEESSSTITNAQIDALFI